MRNANCATLKTIAQFAQTPSSVFKPKPRETKFKLMQARPKKFRWIH